MVKEIEISQNKKEKKDTEVKSTIVTEGGDTSLSSKPKKKISKKTITLLIIALGAMLLCGIFAFYYFGIYKAKPYKKPSDVINLNSEYLVSSIRSVFFANIPTISPKEPRTEVSPINGLLFTKTEMNELKTKRPIAVMINNHAEARPQSGLNSADIVYETLVESGITRYMAIFWSQVPPKVGPIRSARQYYLEWLSPYDPLYIHDGCADTDNPKTDACGNMILYKIKRIGTIGAWRWNDGRRYAPHNEYSSLTSAWEYAEKQNWNSFPSIEAWKFKNDAPASQRGTKTKVSIVFHKSINNNGNYDVIWTYDPKTNTYLKQTGGKPDLDQETNTQVYAKDVIIQEIEMTPAYGDTSGRIIQETMGEGKAIFLLDGKITEGTWKKMNRTDRTTFYDKDGNEMVFNRGRIWISGVSRNEGKFAIIEQ